jgi:hypothetical protein
MTDPVLLDQYINTLKERAQQQNGLEYALGFMYSLLQDLNLDAPRKSTVKQQIALLNSLIDKHNKELRENITNDSWVPACGGTEVPFKSRSGKRLQYVWQPSTGQHAYLDVDSDIILSDEQAEAALAMY